MLGNARSAIKGIPVAKKGEKWELIPGLKNRFMVSTLGRVASLTRKVSNGRGGTRLIRGRILRDFSVGGYRGIVLSVDGVRNTFYVHRLVAIAFVFNPDNKPEVNHNDGDKSNNRVGNLLWATEKENVRHAFKMGLAPKKDNTGSNNPRSILNEGLVQIIRQRMQAGEEDWMLSSDYKVKIGTIQAIRYNQIWKHI